MGSSPRGGGMIRQLTGVVMATRRPRSDAHPCKIHTGRVIRPLSLLFLLICFFLMLFSSPIFSPLGARSAASSPACSPARSPSARASFSERTRGRGRTESRFSPYLKKLIWFHIFETKCMRVCCSILNFNSNINMTLRKRE